MGERTLATLLGERGGIDIFVWDIPEDEELDEGNDENHYGELTQEKSLRERETEPMSKVAVLIWITDLRRLILLSS